MPDPVRIMTYDEIATERRISVTSARRFVLRHRWAKVPGNDGRVRVSVPVTAAVALPTSPAPAVPTTGGHAVGPDICVTVAAAVREAVAPLALLLSEAIAAERIATTRMLQLQGEIDRRKEWSLFRRLRWAIRAR